MTTPLILAFCAPGDAARVTAQIAREHWIISTDRAIALRQIFEIRERYPMRRPILIGVGLTGCGSLAAYVAERGPDGVVAVVLVDPAAAWAERVWLCGYCEANGPPSGEKGCGCEVSGLLPISCGDELGLPLGPLEPLRAVAERARFVCRRHSADGTSIDVDSSGAPIKGPCPWCRAHTPARLVLAVCPEAPPCEACGGQTLRFDGKAYPCHACSGTGRMLSSAEVAGELLGPCRSDGYGGLVTIPYASRSALSEHGIAEALRVALEGT